MAGYVPGEQPRDGGVHQAEHEREPVPPVAPVAEAIAAALDDRLRLYPDPVGTAFREAAARLHGVEPDMILAGNGSDDLLTIITRAFAGPGDLVVSPTPSYILYRTLAELQDARLRRGPVLARLVARPRGLRRPGRAARVPGQPEQPLGHGAAARARSPRSRERLDCPLVVDEAYADFAEADCVGLVAEHPNVIVTRTLQQGLQPGRPPARLPDRPARDRRRADQGQGSRTTATP